MLRETTLTPAVSIIVSTNGRAGSLRHLLDSLSHLDYPNFEVCVVCGPTPDGTRELVAGYGDEVKSAHCPEHNISRSRNMGIALAAGDIVAFIDDDAIPEPEWLAQLTVPFGDDEVGAAGGFVYNHTGYDFQSKWVACDRLGNPRFDLTGPVPEYNFPYSLWYPHLIGTNAAFRRSKLVEIGGFDEEYEYFLDETDVCCRLNDAGQKIVQLANAFVHHKYLPSQIRNANRTMTSFYSILKSKIYFCFVNNKDHYSYQEVFAELVQYVTAHRAAMRDAVDSGELSPGVAESFEVEAQRAWDVGLQRGLSMVRRTRPGSYFTDPPAFRRFSILQPPGGRKTFVFLNELYPPESRAAVSRNTYEMARAIAAIGHTVHVLTKGQEFNRVDFEEGVWVHRIVVRAIPSRRLPDGSSVPQHILDYSGTLLEEIDRTAMHRSITAVEGSGSNWECIAAIVDGRYPCVVNVVTPFPRALGTHAELGANRDWIGAYGELILNTEKYLFTHAQGIIAANSAVIRSVAERHQIDLSGARTCFLQCGVTDMLPLPRSQPKPLVGRAVNNRTSVLFVDRPGLRSGIDVLPALAASLLAQRSDIEFWIAGDETGTVTDGRPVQEWVFADSINPAVTERIIFFGHVLMEELRWLYAECAFVVIPSRFENFSLTAVDAMMFSKPAIGCRSSGSEDVITDGKDGIVVEMSDAAETATAILRLIENPDLRHAMGKAGRVKFEKRFSIGAIIPDRIGFLSSFERRTIDLNVATVHGDTAAASLPDGREGLLLLPASALVLNVDFAKLHVTFFQHRRSGIVEIRAGNSPVQTIDLYAAHPVFRTIDIDTADGTEIRISRADRAGEQLLGAEVIIAMIQASIRS